MRVCMHERVRVHMRLRMCACIIARSLARSLAFLLACGHAHSCADARVVHVRMTLSSDAQLCMCSCVHVRMHAIPSRMLAQAQPLTDSGGLGAVKSFEYRFPPFHDYYHGFAHNVLGGCATAAIIDDYAFWESKGHVASAGKLHVVDYNGCLAETKVQHIFFDGGMLPGNPYCVDVRDLNSGEQLTMEEAEDLFVHHVDFFKVAIYAGVCCRGSGATCIVGLPWQCSSSSAPAGIARCVLVWRMPI